MTITERTDDPPVPGGPEQYVSERASRGSRRITMWTERNTSSGRFSDREPRPVERSTS